MRGNHDVLDAAEVFTDGSPPPARGPQVARQARYHHRRITPACAGTTPTTAPAATWTPDHPRLRGDHPAPSGPAPSADHPRMRGDHLPRKTAAGSLAGPPPHARGPRVRDRAARRAFGTTPACAGTTRRRKRPIRGPRDHPRMRGDHLRTRHVIGGTAGPPPHARGPRRARVGVATQRGTTPACAGTTKRKLYRVPTGRDHPRMRGDHVGPSKSPCRLPGPPPHARGPHAATCVFMGWGRRLCLLGSV